MISLSIPFLPPTDNHAYENVPVVKVRGKIVSGGGRRLTEEGRKFKVETINHLARTQQQALKWFRPNVPYLVWCCMWMPDLLNKGWPKKTPNRYKKLDGHNRIKLVFDALAEVTGVDDSSYWDVLVSKRMGEERVDLYYWDLENECTDMTFGSEVNRVRLE